MIDVKQVIVEADKHIEDILTALDLPYIYKSGWLCINCPFHDGADGYNLRYKDYSWFCFSQCHRNYTIVNIVEKVLDIEFPQALRWLCNEMGITESQMKIDRNTVEIRNKLNRLKSMRTTKATLEYKPVEQTVLNSIEQYNHPYLLEQGFKPETLEYFNIGYSRYGVLMNRIVYPIDAPNGEIIALSGRLPNATKLGLPKYKILEGTKKSYTLYNISRIDPEDKYVIVVEGFKSVMSLYEWGFKSVVATIGSSLSSEQRNLLLSLGRKIICIGDNDEAGQRLNQAIWNQCYKFSECVKINLADFTDIEKASPCESDIGFDGMAELTDALKGVI